MKRIQIDENTKQELIEKFTNYLNGAKLTNERIYFQANILPKEEAEKLTKPTVFIDANAYLKMMLYVRDTATEIAWHGTVERDLEENTYYIKDVFLYPQKVAGATVQTDQEKYNKWCEELDDDTYNELRFQGHSHVNMAVSPSGTDLQYYDDMLQVLPKNDYYIFMILNKQGNMTLLIYDLAANLIYDTKDIDVQIVTENSDSLIDDIEEQKEQLCEKPITTPTYNTYNTYSSYNYPSKTTYPKDDLDDDYLLNRYKAYTKEEETETDKLYNSIDKRYKNTSLEKGDKK